MGSGNDVAVHTHIGRAAGENADSWEKELVDERDGDGSGDDGGNDGDGNDGGGENGVAMNAQSGASCRGSDEYRRLLVDVITANTMPITSSQARVAYHPSGR